MPSHLDRPRRHFIFDVGVFEKRCGSVEWSEKFLVYCLELLAFVNAEVIKCGKIPPLYRATTRDGRPIRYLPESPRAEIFMAIPTILREGGADCEDLSAWRVAELRAAGEPAQFRVDKFAGMLYHIRVQRMVRTPSGWQMGPIEDPSLALGMGDAHDMALRRSFRQ